MGSRGIHAEKKDHMLKRAWIFAGILLLLLAPRISAAGNAIPPPLRVGKVPSAGYLQTALLTDHQGKHEITKCRATLDADGLHLFFPMNPAYHLEIDITVKDGRYATHLRWVPLRRERVENRVASQRLTLEKKAYALGEMVNGFLDLTFTITWPGDGTSHSFYVKGPFSALVRPPGFNPYADENIRTYYDPRDARHELGDDELSLSGTLEGDRLLVFSGPSAYACEPAASCGDDGSHAEAGSADEAHAAYQTLLQQARREFFERKPQIAGAVVQELTWDPTPLTEGNERLTIWFSRAEGGWQQLGFAWWAFDWSPSEKK